MTVPDGDNGFQTWIYVYNDSGSGLVAAKMQTRKAATANYHVAVAGAINPCQAVGLCVKAIPNLSYGFLLRKGIGTVTGAAAVVANKGLILAAAGDVNDEGAITGSAIGNSLGGIGSATTFTAYIDCRG